MYRTPQQLFQKPNNFDFAKAVNFYSLMMERIEILKEAIENIPRSRYIWMEIIKEIDNKINKEGN